LGGFLKWLKVLIGVGLANDLDGFLSDFMGSVGLKYEHYPMDRCTEDKFLKIIMHKFVNIAPVI
jgi:hypothetical protein